MSISPLIGLSSGVLQSVLQSVLPGIGSSNNSTNSTTSIDPSKVQQDGGRLSPLAQLMSTLQQLQQSDPTKYQQVTAQIAANLQTAAQTAQSEGNTTAATQLNQLSTDFTNASKSGQFPNIQDLAQAVGGGHHHGGHHHHHVQSSTDNANGSSSTSPSTSPAGLNQFLSAFQNGNEALNPLSIIENTLSGAGITTG
jgi:hypothetical protein